jgi:hypothetical protein
MASKWLNTHLLVYGNLDLWIGVNIDFVKYDYDV